jgi:hypothetical protein
MAARAPLGGADLRFSTASFTDENTSFVPGRTTAISNLLLDTTGGSAAQAIAALVLLWGHVRECQKRGA